MDNYLDINKALTYLKAGYHLYSLNDKEKVTFYLKNNTVIISSNNVNSKISVYDFKALYLNSHFYILENNEEEVDLLKDKEYYSWRQ